MGYEMASWWLRVGILFDVARYIMVYSKSTKLSKWKIVTTQANYIPLFPDHKSFNKNKESSVFGDFFFSIFSGAYVKCHKK